MIKKTETITTFVLGDESRQIKLDVTADESGRPRRVLIQGASWKAEDLERVAAVLRDMRLVSWFGADDKTGLALESVCPDHGYYRHDYYPSPTECPTCEPEKWEAHRAKQEATQHVS